MRYPWSDPEPRDRAAALDARSYTIARGRFRDEVEAIYEDLLRGNLEQASARCEQVLFNHGGRNEIKNRVALDLRRQAPGAHGQVGQSEADAERASEARQQKEKAA